jgi:hypothetical protein
MDELRKNWWSFIALGSLATLGLFGASVGWAILGAVALGAVRVLELVATKNRYPGIRTTPGVAALYLAQLAASGLAGGCAWGCGSVMGLMLH